MNYSKLEELIKKETTKKEKLINERDALDRKIKECDTNIERYTISLNNNKFKDFQKALSTQGISFEDVMKAIQNGDFLSIQESIEKEKESQNEKNDRQN